MFFQLVRSINSLKFKLTPNEYFMLKGKGQERPFTGEFWWYKDVGTYHCRLCDKALFPSHYKFQTASGHATFFASLKDATRETCSDLSCSNCFGHLGKINEEGPAPTYRTLTVNSAALVFKASPFFQVPPTRNVLKQMRQKEKKRAEKKTLKLSQTKDFLNDFKEKQAVEDKVQENVSG